MKANWVKPPRALLLSGLLVSPCGLASDTLDLCQKLIRPPESHTVIRQQRYLAQLVQLTDQLRAVPARAQELAQCHHLASKALATLEHQPSQPVTQLTAEAAYLNLTTTSKRQLRLDRVGCQTAESVDQEELLPLRRQDVGRYLYQSPSERCSQYVWLGWENRGGDDTLLLLDRILKAASLHAKAQGYTSSIRHTLAGNYLSDPRQIADWLQSLPVSNRELPWQPHAAPRYLNLDPRQLSRAAFTALTHTLGLTLAALDDDSWQVWDQRRYLGVVTLTPGKRTGLRVIQRHIVGHHFGVAEVVYRSKSKWRDSHVEQLLARQSQALYALAGQPLTSHQGEQWEADLHGLTAALGEALGHSVPFRDQLGPLPPTTPRGYRAGELFDAEMALAVWQQDSLDEDQLLATQSRLFQHYFGQPAPPNWRWWNARPQLIRQGPLLYRKQLSRQLAAQLITRWQQGQLSGSQLWRRLYVNTNHQAMAPTLDAMGIELHQRQ
ncbi:hypothetical protein SAMN04488540_11150 [Ferrimonas sediminum]|uniref:Uncharacterized protein n=1 Tax=Ferrimonas sediminum TaxID=718193 RepID=A0A1G8VKC2_9GAMM|nr:hypothetical protein [Ferrimonas sediminum]SDJ65640.1 hypothetical protein SAMN04488540_11150 [Ferrimonas sediminum]